MSSSPLPPCLLEDMYPNLNLESIKKQKSSLDELNGEPTF